MTKVLSVALFLGLASIAGGAWSAFWGRAPQEADRTSSVLRDMRKGGAWGIRAGVVLTITALAGLGIQQVR